MSTKKNKIEEQKYRLLTSRDIIRIGDEYQSWAGEWKMETEYDQCRKAGQKWNKYLVPYRRAIKHPAPKPAAKVKKTKAIKARSGFVDYGDASLVYLSKVKNTDTCGQKVKVIDVSDEAALIEQIKLAIYDERNRQEGERYPFESLHQFQKDKYQGYAYSVALSLGIIAPKKGRK